jgi:hypothetical protein
MVFTRIMRPKYYYAAGLILFMRASRTPKEEEVFQHLVQSWEDWFGTDLNYVALKSGPPTKGSYAYSSDEQNWCAVRLAALDKEIKDDGIRTRLGLGPRETRKKKAATKGIAAARAQEMSEIGKLLDNATVDTRSNGAAAQQAQPSRCPS